MANDKKKPETTPAPTTPAGAPPLPEEGKKTDNSIQFAADDALRARINAAKALAEARAMGVKFPLSNFVRLCVERGLAAVEAEAAK